MISGDPKLPQLTPEEAQDTHLTTGFYRRFQDRFYTLWRDLTRQLAQTGQETSGGTGQTSYTKGDTLYASDTNTLATLAGNTTTTKKFLAQTGNGSSSAAPTWASIIDTDLPTVPASKGGTGQTTYTDGQLLIGNSSGNTLTKATLSQGTGISIVNGNGSITISATGAGGGGDVLGPGGGATDNAVARFDGATGQLIQNSVVVIDDSGNVSGGSWQGSVVSSTYGGTGINNGGRTLTISTNSGTLSFANASKTLTIADTASVSGTNTGDQTITLQGDVTGSGTGTFTTTIADGSVSNAKLANVATATFKGRTTAGAGAPEDLTATQATALLNTFTDANKGLAPASGGGTTNFLRADGTWTTPGGGGTVTSVSVTTANGVSGTVASSTTTPAITLSLGAITPTSVSTGALTATGNVGFDGGTFVFNESGADKDFRVEGDTDANLVFVDASTDRVGIGTNSPSYKLQVEGGAIGKGGALGHHVEAYGAVGNGSTDDRDKIVDAINAAKTGTNGSNVVVFGAKNYRIASTIDIALKDNESVELRGVAPSVDATAATTDVQGTRITFDNNTNNDIAIHVYGDTSTGTATPNHASFIIRDLWIGAEQTSPGTGQIGLQIGETGEILEPYSKSIVDNVRCEDFSGAGFKVINTRRLHLLRCIAYTVGDTGGGIGCHIIATGTNYTAGDVVIDGCEFSAGGSAGTERAIKVEADSSGALCSGILVSNTVCYFGEAGIDIYASNAGTISDVFITNTQVDGFQTSGDADADLDYALYIRTDTAASVISNVHVSNSYFAAYNLHGVYLKGGGGSSTLRNCALIGNSIKWNDSHGIKMESVYGASIVGNVFNNNGTTATVNGDANIYVSLCQYFSIANNSGYNLNASTTNAYGVYLAADYSDQFSVVNNSMVAGYAATEDNSTGSNKTLSANYS